MRKLLIIVLLLSFSFNSLSWGGGMDTTVLWLILKEDTAINLSTYTSLGKQIIEMFFNRASVKEYAELIPMRY